MQIPTQEHRGDHRRVDFNGNKVDGIFISIADEDGITRFSRQLTETERLQLVDTITRSDNGRAV